MEHNLYLVLWTNPNGEMEARLLEFPNDWVEDWKHIPVLHPEIPNDVKIQAVIWTKNPAQETYVWADGEQIMAIGNEKGFA